MDYSYKNKSKQNSYIEDSIQNESENGTIASKQELDIIAKLTDFYDWRLFKSDWIEVFPIRHRDIKSMDYPDLINKWPQLKNVEIAFHLVFNEVFNYVIQFQIMIFITGSFRFSIYVSPL